MSKQNNKNPDWQQTSLNLDYTRSLEDLIERLPETRKNGGKYFLRELLKKEGADSVMAFLLQAVDESGNPKALNKYSFTNSQKALFRGVGLSWPRSTGTRDGNLDTFYTLLTSGVSAFNAAKVATGTAPIVSEETAIALGSGALAGILISDKLLQARIATVAKTIDDYVQVSRNLGRVNS